MLNILIASDHKLFRTAIARLLSAQPLFNVIAVCADTHAAMFISASERPDIVLIDGSSDPLAAIEATKKIIASSAAGVIAISRQADPLFARHMLAAGALGYLTSQSYSMEVIAAIEEVAKDNFYSCLNTRHVPVPTPERFSSLKKSIAAIKNNSNKKIAQAMENHWHGILKLTN
ncbi:MAG: response regulator transcription factor [Bacteroidota bacterium]